MQTTALSTYQQPDEALALLDGSACASASSLPSPVRRARESEPRQLNVLRPYRDRGPGARAASGRGRGVAWAKKDILNQHHDDRIIIYQGAEPWACSKTKSRLGQTACGQTPAQALPLRSLPAPSGQLASTIAQSSRHYPHHRHHLGAEGAAAGHLPRALKSLRRQPP